VREYYKLYYINTLWDGYIGVYRWYSEWYSGNDGSGGGGGFTREANFCRPSRLKSFRIPLCATQDYGRLYIYTVNDSLLPIRIVAIKMSHPRRIRPRVIIVVPIKWGPGSE